ncbi:MAG: serine hydrolase [Eubacteriales bacterium]|nr:serine hydrolase [Eubacteriales bacterium]
MLQPEEVVEAKWVSIQEFEDMREVIVPTVWERFLTSRSKLRGMLNYREYIDVNFRGAILIKNENETFEYVNGYRDYANELPNTLDTKFASASAGKVFVAVAILQLIEKKLLKFDDTIGELIDMDWKNIDRNVTVEELLNHTSGVPDYFDESVMEEYEELWVDYPNYKIRHNKDLLPLFMDKPMMYSRGTRFQYNNTGYVILAMIIEKITGMEFDEYLKQNVFDVCGMTGTGYYELDKLPAKCAVNYLYCNSEDDLRTNIFCVDAKGTGAGGAFITVNDIVKFWTALIEGKLISKTMFEKMISKQSGDGEDEEEGYYGFGVWIIDGKGQKDIPYFQGCDPGVSFISEYNPNTGTISVLVSNYGDNVWRIARELRQ